MKRVAAKAPLSRNAKTVLQDREQARTLFAEVQRVRSGENPTGSITVGRFRFTTQSDTGKAGAG